MENNFFTIVIWFVGEPTETYYKLSFDDFYNSKLTSNADIIRGLTEGDTADLTTFNNMDVTIVTDKIKQICIPHFESEIESYIEFIKHKGESSNQEVR